MEDPLLQPSGRGEGAKRNKVAERVKQNVPIAKHAAALGLGTTYEKAAALVDKAMDGEGLSTGVLQGLSEGGSQAHFSYFLFTFLEPLWNANLLVLFLLNFFEVPLWCKHPFPNPCKDSGQYGLSGVPFLSRQETLMVEIVTAFILVLEALWPLTYMKRKAFFSWSFDLVQVILCFLLVVDVVLYALFVLESGPINDLPFRAAPYLRVLVIIFAVTNLRRMLFIFVTSFMKYLDMGVILALYLLFTSWLAYILFEDTPQGQENFSSFTKTLYHMNVLLQTQDSPDQWLVAYKSSRLSCIFFIIYLVFGLYFIMNLVLAVIFDSFKDRLGQDYEMVNEREKETLEHVFDMLDEQRRGYIDFSQTCDLLNELNRYRMIPVVKKDHMDEVFTTMDDTHDAKISKEEFVDLCKIVGLKFRDPPEESFLASYAPRLWHSQWFGSVKWFVRSPMFDRLIWGILILNMATVIVETTLDVSDSKLQFFWVPLEHAIGWLYVLEMLLKISVLGFRTYWKDNQNQFDFIITILIALGELILLIDSDLIPVQNQEWIRYLLIARLLRLTRLLTAAPRLRVIISAFFRLVPGLTPLIVLLFFTLCLFNSLGMQLFGGLLYKGNPKLEGTDYDEKDFYLIHFNDYISGLVLLFNALVTEGDATWQEALGAVSGGSWAPYIFLNAFYYICTSYVVELVASFVLDAFFVEKELVEKRMGAEYTVRMRPWMPFGLPQREQQQQPFDSPASVAAGRIAAASSKLGFVTSVLHLHVFRSSDGALMHFSFAGFILLDDLLRLHEGRLR